MHGYDLPPLPNLQSSYQPPGCSNAQCPVSYNDYKQCQQHWSLYLMAGSWALVEVPRYLFYAANLVMKRVPYPLFFLRYNLFMVLYPSGITGTPCARLVSWPCPMF